MSMCATMSMNDARVRSLRSNCSSAATGATGITPANVASLRRTQVQLDGTVDASAIYLHGVRVNGATHDVLVDNTPADFVNKMLPAVRRAANSLGVNPEPLLA